MASNDNGTPQPAQGSFILILEGEAHSDNNIGAKASTPLIHHQEEGTQNSAAQSNLASQDIQPAFAPWSMVERYLKLSPPHFNGSKDEDAAVAEFWLEKVERFLDILEATSTERAQCAIASLSANAYNWWTTVDSPAVLTWEFFVTQFEDCYMGDVYREAMRRKFLDLKQGALAVTEYESEFTKYSKYASELVNTGRKMCFYFQEGLNFEYKPSVVGHKYENFSALLGHVMELERWAY